MIQECGTLRAKSVAPLFPKLNIPDGQEHALRRLLTSPGPRGLRWRTMKRIPLTQGQFALVDDEDYEWLSQYKWQAMKKRPKLWCASRHSKWDGKRSSSIKMHRNILDAKRGQQVDHINGDSLDNRKANLRLCTGSQNQMNSHARKNGNSKYKGVCWDKRSKFWQVAIRINKRNVYLGIFRNEKNAALAYDDAARKYHGEYGRYNFPKDGERSALR